jgi:urocanate hydratase
LLDGSEEAGRRLRNMLFYDVNNGIARRAWARNKNAVATVQREMKNVPELIITPPNPVDDDLIDRIE